MLHTLIATLVMLCSPYALTQDAEPGPAEAPLAPLAFLVGEWEGEGSIRMGPGNPHQFTQHETVESRMDGRVLLIEGIGYDINHEDAVVHHAFAVLTYDDTEERFVMRAYRAVQPGRTIRVDAEAQVVDGALIWSYEHPQAGLMRYTIREDEEGRWHETGEMSRDGGETWFPFFEMVLERVE